MHPIDQTHDPDLKCWVEGADEHPEFPIQNLPLGVFSRRGGARRLGCAIGERILDLAAIAAELPSACRAALLAPVLNPLMALPDTAQADLRQRLSALLSSDGWAAKLQPALHPASECALHAPVAIGDFTDFYTGIHHATNAGGLFRPDAPLPPNYKWMPIAYHSRASSVRISGAPLFRPDGQLWRASAGAPEWAPTERLDFELELGVWISRGRAGPGAIPVGRAGEHVFGLSLLNDWSARDIQLWEAQPLGPFLAKNFQTTISPWIVTAAALAPFRTAQPPRPAGDPAPLPYLHDEADQRSGALAIDLEAHLITEAIRARGAEPYRLTRVSAEALYWTAAQMIAHHTVGGCNLVTGDLLGTGTISGVTEDSLGCLLERTRNGERPLDLPGGEQRRYLEDGDEVVFTAHARAPNHRQIGFGECRGRIFPRPAEAD